MNTLITMVVALVTAFVGPVAVEWTKNKFLHKYSKDALGESIDISEKIDTQLEFIMEELKCDRLCIAQFHNGGNFYPTGKSIKKFSIFYECISKNATSVKETFQNIPVSLFPKIFSTIYKSGEINISSCKNNTVDCGLFPIEGREYKTKSFYMLSIEDLSGNFIGTLTISYYNQEHKLTLDEWILLRQKVGAIGGILTNYLHNKK